MTALAASLFIGLSQSGSIGASDFFMPVAPDRIIGSKLQQDKADIRIDTLPQLPYEVSDLYFLSSAQGDALGFRAPTAMLPGYEALGSTQKVQYTLLIDEWKKYELVERKIKPSDDKPLQVESDWFQIGVAVRTIVFIRLKDEKSANSSEVTRKIFGLLRNPSSEEAGIEEMWATTLVIGLRENEAITGAMPSGWRLLTAGGLLAYLEEAAALRKVIWKHKIVQPIVLGVRRSRLSKWYPREFPSDDADGAKKAATASAKPLAGFSDW